MDVRKSHLYLLFLTIALLHLSSCVAPWYGEENNYPVVVLEFANTAFGDRIAIQDLNITYLKHLESDRNLPIGNAFEQDKMDFDSRVDERYALLLPIDKSQGQSTFIVGNDNQKDTLVFQYRNEQHSNLDGDWDIDVSWFSGVSLTYDDFNWCFEECPSHPKIIDYLTIIL